MKARTAFVIAALLSLVLSYTAAASEFYAYYTRLPYVIPIDRAAYVQIEPDADSRAILEAMEAAQEEDEPDLGAITFEDLPEAVRKAARQEYPDEPFMAVEREQRDDQLYYHVMFEVDGTEAGLLMSANGRILDRWHFDADED